MTRSRADILDDIRAQIGDYVSFRKRVGDPITFQSALRSHRLGIEVALEDTKDDAGTSDPDLRERLELLDDLCMAEGVAP